MSSLSFLKSVSGPLRQGFEGKSSFFIVEWVVFA